MTDALQIVLENVNEDPTVRFFALVIAGIFLAAFLFGFLARVGPEFVHNRLHRFVQAAPGLMTTFGVLGTFWGIFIGLREFDVTNIDASVPLLLEGLKVAFVTSVLGMGAGALFRLIEHSGRAIFGGYPATDDTDDPLAQLIAIRDELQKQTGALVGDNDGSILTTLKTGRVETLDGFKSQNEIIQHGFDAQILAFTEFAEHMKENTSKALIEALEEVIRDFNVKLTEQFGENFKQLNEAVGSLVQWQDNYRQHVESLEQQIALAVEGIEKSRDSIVIIAEKAERIPPMVEGLETASAKALEQIAAQHGLLEAIASIRPKAEDVIPKIEANIVAMTEGMKEATERQQKALDETISSMSAGLHTAYEETQSAINGSFRLFDEQMQQELTRVLSEMGSKLASLSEKFVSDYTPLTRQLQRIVEIANGVRT